MKRDIKVITKETLLKVLDAHPEWIYMQYDRMYGYEPEKKCFVWEGWDDYNDDMSSDKVYLELPKKWMPAWERRHGAYSHFAIVDNREIWLWLDCQWNRPKKERFRSPGVSFNVYARVDLGKEI